MLGRTYHEESLERGAGVRLVGGVGDIIEGHRIRGHMPLPIGIQGARDAWAICECSAAQAVVARVGIGGTALPASGVPSASHGGNVSWQGRVMDEGRCPLLRWSHTAASSTVELARGSGDTLEVSAYMAEQYGVFPRTWERDRNRVRVFIRERRPGRVRRSRRPVRCGARDRPRNGAPESARSVSFAGRTSTWRTVVIRWRAENEKTGYEHRTPVTAEVLTVLEEARARNRTGGGAPVLPAPKDPFAVPGPVAGREGPGLQAM